MADEAPLTETPEELPETTPPTSPPAEPTPPPTPNPNDERIDGMSKTVQKLSQEIAQLTRKLDQNGTLNQVEQAKLAQAKSDAQRVTQELEAAANAGDGSLAATLAQATLEQKRRNDALEAELQRLRQKVDSNVPAARPAEQVWADQQAKYPGVEVKKVWKAAMDTALSSPTVRREQQRLNAGQITQEEFDATLQDFAQAIYHERAKAAPAPALPTANGLPPKTPPGRPVVPMPGAQPTTPANPEDARSEQMLKRLSY